MISNLFKKEIKACIFDVDNTILATDEFVVKNIFATVDRLTEGGFFVEKPSQEDIFCVQAQNLPFEDIFKQLFLGMYDGREIWEFVLENYRAYASQQYYNATHGALETIRMLKEEGLILCLVTNRVNMLEERLKQAGFDVNDFLCMCIPPAPEFRKPHPKAFEKAINCLSVFGIRTEQTVMCGDHLDDYYSSFYQNIKFIPVLQGRTSREEFLDVGIEKNIIIDDLSDIGEAIKNIVVIDQYKKSLYATSALDGRHGVLSAPFRHYFSEYALHKYRVKVEVEHLITLSEFFYGQVVRILDTEEKDFLRKLYTNFSEHEAYEILQYDHLGRNGIGSTEHDVKSCELWIKEKLNVTFLKDITPLVHIFVTSEDINNIAYKLMMKDALEFEFVPNIVDITEKLAHLCATYMSTPVMARTHLQPASPTTFGKIFANYLIRCVHGMERLNAIHYTAKINGAVGNYNTFVSAFPDLDWIKYSQELARRFGFDCELCTDQRGTHVDMIQILHAVQEIGNVVRDMAQDMSLFAGFGTMYFNKVESHVGSSVMPHKINPWFAEVAEGNIKKANWLISGFASELDVSRLQRDLSDHEFERSYGEAIGYVYIAIKHIQIALDFIQPNVEYARQEIDNNPQIVTEAIQTILRKYGRTDAYELVKQKTRGKEISLEDIKSFVIQLDIPDDARQEILTQLDPQQYIGLAQELTRRALEKYIQFKNSL